VIEVLIFRIDSFSFWVGFIAGLLFAWLFVLARRGFPGFVRFIRSQIASARESLTTGTENRMRQDVLNWAQKQHLAAPLFSLNEIAIQPKLLNPPNYSQLEDELFQDIATLTVPYMPDWPELAAHYGAVTLTLPQALQLGADIVVIGHPGSGKTVALAHLASQMARREPAVGDLAHLFPLFIPAPALHLRIQTQEPINALLQTMTGCYASRITMPRLKNVLRFLLQSGRVLLLLDGLDELAPDAIEDIRDYVLKLRHLYPKLRMVAAASFADFGRLQILNLAPLAMASWSAEDKMVFVGQWQHMWNNAIAGDDLSSPSFIDSMLLTKWLTQKEVANSPFETTLRTWGAFAGDTLGPNIPSLVYAHLRRLSTQYSNAFPALEAIALAMIEKRSPVLQQREAESAINQYMKSFAADTGTELPGEVNAEPDHFAQEKESASRKGSAAQLLASFINNGILISYGSSQITFAHPCLMGYLAGRAYSGEDTQGQLDPLQTWTGWLVALGFLGCFSDITPIVEKMLAAGQQTPIYQSSFQAARWLQLAPKNATWRNAVMRFLLEILQKDYETLVLSGRALTALILANDPGILNLLRQLTRSNHANIRQLAALGLGVIGDDKITEQLSSMIDDVSPGVMRAACLSLISLNTTNSLETVITALLNHNEAVRRAAAEALVNHPKEGIDILKEGIAMDDLLVRRAVIYGMVRLGNQEFQEILEKTAIEDAQWVVRNAATQALELLKTSRLNVPSPEISLFNQSWLIEFAAKTGIGVGDPEQANKLVLQALERGEFDERMHALEHLRKHASAEAVPILYHTYFGSQSEVREACYDVLWHLASSAVEMPSPHQFGLG
jgi:HEAT repeat protein